jgi:hypothetical protein
MVRGCIHGALVVAASTAIGEWRRRDRYLKSGCLAITQQRGLSLRSSCRQKKASVRQNLRSPENKSDETPWSDHCALCARGKVN